MGTVLLGLDVGRARIGLARAELGTTLAFGRGALTRRGTAADVAAIRELAEAEGAGVVVVGLPRPTRGEDSPQTRLVRDFAAALERAGLSVALEDERFTTALSERRLREAGAPQGRRRSKAAVDEASAVLILESYLQRAAGDAVAADPTAADPTAGDAVAAESASADPTDDPADDPAAGDGSGGSSAGRAASPHADPDPDKEP